jgi:prepilin peptidase CpaA
VGIVLGLTLHAQMRGPQGLLTSLQGLSLAFGVYFCLYLVRAMGAGDVKLMAAIGSLVGPANWLILLLFVAATGAIVALLIIALRGRLCITLQNVALAAADLARLRVPAERHPQLDVYSGKGLALPHALPIALGTYAFLLGRMLHW